MASSTEIKHEQAYFDRAWEERERKRANLKDAYRAGAGPNKGIAEVRRAADRELEKIGGPDDAVAFGRFDQNGDAVYIGNHMIADQEGCITQPFDPPNPGKPIGRCWNLFIDDPHATLKIRS